MADILQSKSRCSVVSPLSKGFTLKGLIQIVLLFQVLAACKTTGSNKSSDTLGNKEDLKCKGKDIEICKVEGQHPLDEAIELVLKQVQKSVDKHGIDKKDLDNAFVACTEVAYPGNEALIKSEEAQRGTFICLFNTSFVMNMALNRLSTFIEDFETVDASSSYSDKKWVKNQIDDGTMGHNLESQDLQRYLKETKVFIDKRAKSDVKGIQVESEFLEKFIRPTIDAAKGKPKSILLGVYLPEEGKKRDAAAELKAVLGHEIFHSLYFHSEKMQKLVKDYVDASGPADVAMMKRKLMQKGYAVENKDGTPPSEKQQYMFYNEAEAYLLESGACTDGAFMAYSDEDSEEPEHIIEKTAPLVVKHAAKLRQVLLKENVMSAEWASKWSPDLVLAGCKSK